MVFCVRAEGGDGGQGVKCNFLVLPHLFVSSLCVYEGKGGGAPRLLVRLVTQDR